MRVVVAATAHVAIPTLEWLNKSEHELVRIVTTPDSRSGRGKVLTQSQIAVWANENSIPIFKPSTVDEMKAAFEDCDIVIAIAYGKILSANILDLPRYGFINLHFSLLPAYRGAAPVQRALLNGESVTGYSIFKIDQNLDTGPIYHQEKYDVDTRATSGDVLKALSERGAKAFSQVLNDIEMGVQPIKQVQDGISFAPKISKQETRINWKARSASVLNTVRAFTPTPGAWTNFQGIVLKITELGLSTTETILAPGIIHIENKKLFVGTLDIPIEVSKVIPAGKKEMTAAEWLNGARIAPGETFE